LGFNKERSFERDEQKEFLDDDVILIEFRLPFSIIWRDDLKDDNIKIPCSSLLIALGATASGKTNFLKESID
jgi:hypothetical protein